MPDACADLLYSSIILPMIPLCFYPVKEYVKSGGRLLYSTCTIHRGENEDNAGWFVRQNPEFGLIREQQMLPGRDGGDGFYIAMFRRN